MKVLKRETLILVGTEIEKSYFKSYFKTVYRVDENKEVVALKRKYISSVVLLYSKGDKKGIIEIIKEIKSTYNSNCIGLLLDSDTLVRLAEIASLDIFGYILKQNIEDKIEQFLSLLSYHISYKECMRIPLSDGYKINLEKYVVYNHEKSYTLTNNEIKLITLLIDMKNTYVSSERLEYHLWEDSSMDIDCTKRLKNLIFGLRKKLPKGCLENKYQLGYRLNRL